MVIFKKNYHYFWFVFWFIFWFIFWFSLTVSAHSQTHTSLVKTIQNAINARCLDDNQTSVRVVALPQGKEIYDYNSYQPLLPASVMKIVTTAAALHYLGPDYRFKTEVLHNGYRHHDTIHGDLILRGGGDPRLSTEHLWQIASQIKASGINRVTGNLVMDTQFFDELDRAPAWEVERTQRAYDAKLSALSLNFNTIAIHILPSVTIGHQVSAWLEPVSSYMSLNNEAKTVKRGRTTVWASRENKPTGEVEVLVRGQIPLESKEKIIRINVETPKRYTTETFKNLLKQVGVVVHGEITTAFAPTAGTELYQHLSPPLSLILKELNTFSNNFTAEQIVKSIAAENFKHPGSHTQGLELINTFLQNNSVNLQGVLIQDGSGLSRKNRMTTRAITDLLKAMYSRFDIGPDFIAALRLMATKGILSQRLKRSSIKGQIRAKTGTLQRVSTLAGYVATPQGKVFAYAIFSNNNSCGPWRADRIEDRIVTAINALGDEIF